MSSSSAARRSSSLLSIARRSNAVNLVFGIALVYAVETRGSFLDAQDRTFDHDQMNGQNRRWWVAHEIRLTSINV